MKSIVIIGGGRWARVHISVLRAVLDFEDRIYWLTKHNASRNQLWLNSNDIQNICIVKDEAKAWALNPRAVIIASATPEHANFLRKAIDLGIPALCEKPFALDVATGIDLANESRDKKIVTGVNLEYFYANYLWDFAKVINNLAINSIHILWHDPKEEIRYGDVKSADKNTPHMHDAIPHCWSLLKVICPYIELEIKEVYFDRKSALTNVILSSKESSVFLSLTRFASTRQRIININNGEAILNFSNEPGITSLQGRESKNLWSGDRPMAGALKSFLAQIESPIEGWPLSLTATMPAVTLASNCHDMNISSC